MIQALKTFFRFWRIHFLFLCFLVVGATLIGRLFFLQVENKGFYRALAQGQHNFFKTLIPTRGEIFFEERTTGGEQIPIPVAINSITKSAIISPREVRDPSYAASQLSEILQLDEEHTEMVLSERGSYVILKKDITQEEEEGLKKEDIAGLYLRAKQKREYPEIEHGAHILGFVGQWEEGERGQYGIEGFYDSELAGKENGSTANKTTSGGFFGASSRFIPSKGVDIHLTIDYNIQYMAEKLLSERVDLYDAQGGQVVVMDPRTGRIIALAVEPSFDPNSYFLVDDLSRFLNPVTQKQFEPGSVFKPFVVATALEQKKVTPSTIYHDYGFIRVGVETIKNFEDKVHGDQTVSKILEKSINTGIVYISQFLEKDEIKSAIKRFGFGSRTGIDLPGEIEGNISNLEDERDIHYATAAFGQGIAVTPIQLISAFSVFANGGKSIRPFVANKKVFANGDEEFLSDSSWEGEQIISKETAATMNSMLVGVVENGTGKRARLTGYSIAGKSGTAQVPKRRGQGYGEETVHSFVGYAPAFDPRFIILVKIDNPLGVRAAGGSVVPLFKELVEYIVSYYEIPPDISVTSKQ